MIRYPGTCAWHRPAVREQVRVTSVPRACGRASIVCTVSRSIRFFRVLDFQDAPACGQEVAERREHGGLAGAASRRKSKSAAVLHTGCKSSIISAEAPGVRSASAAEPFLFVQADIDRGHPAGWSNDRMQGLDAPTARICSVDGSLGIDGWVGLIETLCFAGRQTIQHPPDFTRFRAHRDRLETNFNPCDDLQQAVRVERDFGNIRPGRREEQVEETEPNKRRLISEASCFLGLWAGAKLRRR